MAAIDELREKFRGGRDPLAYLSYAQALVDSGQYPQALDVCLQGLKGRSALAGHKLLARIYFTMGRYEEAARAIEILLRESPESFQGNLLYAKIQARRGNWDKVQQTLRSLEDLNPDDPEVRELASAVRKEVDQSARLTPIDPAGPSFETPVHFDDFKSLVSSRLGGQAEVGFCFFQKAVPGDLLKEDKIEPLIGMVLHSSFRIVRELGLGDLKGLMMDYENGYVLANSADGEYLVAQFSRAVSPGQMRQTLNKYLSLKP